MRYAVLEVQEGDGMRTKVLYGLLLVVLCGLVGCASGPRYGAVAATIPSIEDNRGRIYFYRSRTMFGAAVQADIRLNGEVVGKSIPGGFFYVDTPPGDYTVSCATKAKRTVTFTLATGETRYVRTHVAMGLFVGRLHPIVEDEMHAHKTLVKASYIGQQSTN